MAAMGGCYLYAFRVLLLFACRDLTRGQGAFTAEKMRDFVRTQVRGLGGIPDSAADALEAMTPSSYVGVAPELARDVTAQMRRHSRGGK